MRSRDRAALWLVIGTMTVSVFAIGGAPRWAALAASALGLASAAPYLTSRRGLPWRVPLVALLLAAAGLSLLQCIPLPAAIVGLLSPARLAQARDAAHATALDAPSWVALSASPSTTLLEAAKLVGYVGVAMACARLSQFRRAPGLLAASAAAIALAAATLAWAHEAVDASRFLGVYVPEHGSSSPLRSSFVNPNHFASLLALALPLAAGCALAAKDVRARWAWAIAGTALGATLLAVASRGGTLAAAVGMLAFIALVLAATRAAGKGRIGSQGKIALCAAAAGVLALLWAMFGTQLGGDLAGTTLDELGDENTKFGAWRSSLAVIRDYPWFGVGRGALESVFTGYHGPSAERTYAFIENGPLQVILDFGLLGALVLAGLSAFVVRSVWSVALKSPVHAGIAAAAIAVLVHNLVDFGLQLPGIAYPTIAVLAVVSRGPSQVRSRRVILSGVALAVGAAIIAASALSPGLYGDRATLRDRLADASSSEDVHGALAAHASRHPYDYLAYALAARGLIENRDPSAARVLNLGRRLHPTHPDLRRTEGDLLLAAGYRAQAALAYRAALERRQDPRVLAYVIDQFPSDDLVLRALPVTTQDPGGDRRDRIVRTLLGHKRPVAADAYAGAVLALGEPSADFLAAAGAAAVAVGRPAEAVERLERAFAKNPEADLARTLADALLSNGAAERAWEVTRMGLARGGANPRKRVALHWTGADAAEAQGDRAGARAELEAAVDSADSRSTEIAARRRLADFEERGNNAHAAEFQRSKIREIKALNPKPRGGAPTRSRGR